MFLHRFIHLQIYNAEGTSVEYDNQTDTNWGVTEGSMNLEKILMDSELKYGNINSARFEIQVFGLDVELGGRKIKVEAIEEFELYPDSEDTTTQISPLFAGWIESSDKDYMSTDRNIIAYDWFYYHRKDNIADWWNTYWEPVGTTPISTDIASFRSDLLQQVGLTSVTSGTFINDAVEIHNTFAGDVTSLAFETILNSICILQNKTPVMVDFDSVEFVQLGTTIAHDLTENVEGENCKWQDFTTATITGIGVYDSSNELAQLYGTETNVYNIVGNIFLLDMTADEINTVCAPILTDLATISYVPAELKCIVSDFTYTLGDYIETEHGHTYIMSTTYDGSLLVEQSIQGVAESEKLSDRIETINDDLINGNKFAKIIKNIDEFTIDYGNFKRETEATLTVLEDEIVLKVTTGGHMVLVSLGEDPDDTGATIFQVSADNISFFADNSMQLTANHLGIYSTYFQVDEYGNVIANSLTARNEGSVFTTIIDTDEMKVVNNLDDDVYVSILAQAWTPPFRTESYTSGRISISDGDYESNLTSRDLYIHRVNSNNLYLMGPYHRVIEELTNCGLFISKYNEDTELYSGFVHLLGEEADIAINQMSIINFNDGEPFICDYRGAGFITTSASKVWFTFPLPKSAYGMNVTCVDFIGRIRLDGKYIHGVYNGMNPINAVAHVTADGYNLQVELTKGVNAQQQLIPYGNKKKLNNRVVGIDLDGTFIFTKPIPVNVEEEEEE